jgi:hypothetical protein
MKVRISFEYKLTSRFLEYSASIMIHMNYFRVTLPLNISLMHTFVQVKAFLDFSKVLWGQISHKFILELWV